MSKVAFINMPAFGLINPTLPLAAELVRRGEEVTYYATEEFQDLIERSGAAFRTTARATSEQAVAALAGATVSGAGLIEFTRALLVHTDVALNGLLPVLRENPPDYIVHDSYCVWGTYLARLLSVPAIASIATFAVNRWTLLASLSKTVPLVIQRRHDLRRLRLLAGNVIGKHSFPPPRLTSLMAGYEPLNIVFTSRMFQPLGHTFDRRFKFVGVMIDDPTDPGDVPRDAGINEPTVYISLGTVFHGQMRFYRTCVDALRGLDVRVVIKIGPNTDVDALGPLPPNFIPQSWIPSQVELLRRCDLFVTHGGMNSVSESLYFGVPVIVIPQAMEHEWVGQRVRRLGAGTVLHGADLTAHSLRRAATDTLSSQRYRDAAKRLGSSLREAGGKVRAADEILQFVAKSHH